jgi:hypothetical protein
MFVDDVPDGPRHREQRSTEERYAQAVAARPHPHGRHGERQDAGSDEHEQQHRVIVTPGSTAA